MCYNSINKCLPEIAAEIMRVAGVDIKDERIDGGKAFDWGRTSEDYARYRDIYPDEFYRRITEKGLCVNGQRVLDLGTGTGVLPRNMYRFGAKWTGTDISAEQIAQAKAMSGNMDIEYYVVSAEDIDFPENSFDIITACQCFWYFDHERLIPKLVRMLRPGGVLLLLYMAWLPYEDRIAGESEKLVLKYSPAWSGAGETRHQIFVPECCNNDFEQVCHEEYPLKVHFTRKSWNGRMKACRGVGASLTPEEIKNWECEHIKLLSEIAPEEFDVLHYGAMTVLKSRKN